MSAGGVIPPPDERKPYVRNLGSVEAMDGDLVTVGVDYDAVIVNANNAAFTRSMTEEFAHLFIAACWEAGENAKAMRETVPPH